MGIADYYYLQGKEDVNTDLPKDLKKLIQKDSASSKKTVKAHKHAKKTAVKGKKKSKPSTKNEGISLAQTGSSIDAEVEHKHHKNKEHKK